MNPLLLPAIAFAATLLFILALRPLAIAVSLIDKPDERKVHKGEIPLIGGVAIYLALLVTVLAGVVISGDAIASDRVLFSYFGAAYLLVAVGVWDDKKGLSPSLRLATETSAALIMVYGAQVLLTDLGALSPKGTTLFLGWFAVPFTIFATVGVINAVNMCDGLDGLSGMLTLVMLAGLGAANTMWGSVDELPLLNILSGAVAGFLAFNQRMAWRNKAWVFLGDAGSMMLGFSLAWMVIEITQVDLGSDMPRILSPSMGLWFLMVPVMDTVAIMLRRIRKGKSPFHADAEHLHHLFVRSGFSVGEALAAICSLAFIGCIAGLLFRYFLVPDIIVAGSFVALGVAYLFFVDSCWRKKTFLGREIV